MIPPDIFFSEDGLGESRHVFLSGNRLPGAWEGRSEFVVSELGFGTGLNALAVAALAVEERAQGRLVPRILYQSVEWDPQPLSKIQALGEQWPVLRPLADELAVVYKPEPGWNRWSCSWGDLVLWVGDARALPDLQPSFEVADAWFLDGFAPDRCPELWDPRLLAWVGLMTRSSGTAATYSAAGVVKRGLREAGFLVKRWPGWGKKRHMVHAVKQGLP